MYHRKHRDRSNVRERVVKMSVGEIQKLVFSSLPHDILKSFAWIREVIQVAQNTILTFQRAGAGQLPIDYSHLSLVLQVIGVRWNTDI